MDFSYSERVRGLQDRLTAFMGAHVYPAERMFQEESGDHDGGGGDYIEAAIRAIGCQGRHLIVGFVAGIPKLPLNLPLLKSCQVIGVFWGEFASRFPAQHAANVAALTALYGEGRIRPAVTERFALAQGGAAIARLEARTARGKLVVVID